MPYFINASHSFFLILARVGGTSDGVLSPHLPIPSIARHLHLAIDAEQGAPFVKLRAFYQLFCKISFLLINPVSVHQTLCLSSVTVGVWTEDYFPRPSVFYFLFSPCYLCSHVSVSLKSLIVSVKYRLCFTERITML